MRDTACHHFRLSFLAAKERLGMALEIVCEHAYRPRRAAHLLEGVVQFLELRGIRLDDVVGAVQRAGALLNVPVAVASVPVAVASVARAVTRV